MLYENKKNKDTINYIYELNRELHFNYHNMYNINNIEFNESIPYIK